MENIPKIEGMAHICHQERVAENEKMVDTILKFRFFVGIRTFSDFSIEREDLFFWGNIFGSHEFDQFAIGQTIRCGAGISQDLVES